MTDEKSEHEDADLRHILGYIGAVRDALRMQNWDIVLHPTMADEENNAETWQHENAFTINIQLGPAFFTKHTPAGIRNTITHELVHAQHRDVSEVWDACTQKNSSIAVDEALSWDRDFRMHMERFVDWIAGYVSQHVPEYSPRKNYGDHFGCALLGEHLN